jgi:D-aspartate ligase
MKAADTSVPVVVLVARTHGALGIVRSLGRWGIRVYGIDAKPFATVFKTRYCAGSFIWDIHRAQAEESVEFLGDVARKIGERPILISTSDASSVFIADHAESLQNSFLFARPPQGLVRALSDKKQMYFLCKKLGIPTAETIFPQSKEEVLNCLDSLTFPVVLKAMESWLPEKRTGVRIVIVENKETLLENYDRFENPEHPNLMIQEYIPGGAESIWMFNGYFNNRSDCLFGFTGKKLRQHPVYTGMASLGICLQNDVVKKNTEEFMKVVGYQGILDMGYRYDARDGKYKVLDVNPRVGATFRLFVAPDGMDVVRALYLDFNGEPVPPAVPGNGRKWIVENNDLFAFYGYHIDGKLTFKEWARSFQGVQEVAWFAWDDPFPFAVMCARFFRLLIRWLALALKGKTPAERVQELTRPSGPG